MVASYKVRNRFPASVQSRLPGTFAGDGNYDTGNRIGVFGN